jgi:hypothetical protein
MQYLTLDGYLDVPVITSAPKMREEAIGGVRRAFSGMPRSSVRGYYRVWEGIETRWITVSDGEFLLDALKIALPIAATGRMVGTAYVLAVNVQRLETTTAIVAGIPTEMVRIGFDLWETVES